MNIHWNQKFNSNFELDFVVNEVMKIDDMSLIVYSFMMNKEKRVYQINP